MPHPVIQVAWPGIQAQGIFGPAPLWCGLKQLGLGSAEHGCESVTKLSRSGSASRTRPPDTCHGGSLILCPKGVLWTARGASVMFHCENFTGQVCLLFQGTEGHCFLRSFVRILQIEASAMPVFDAHEDTRGVGKNYAVSTSMEQSRSEPIRALHPGSAKIPPKRFSRTIWRSLARRLLASATMKE